MLLRALVLALLLATLAAPPASAISVIPDEDAVALSNGGGRIAAAMVGDVDGDGVRELVRLLSWSTNSGQQAVEVTGGANGAIRSHGEVLLQRTATSETSDLQRRPNAENLLPVGINEPARLIAWQEDEREAVLVATIGTVGLVSRCCLTLWRVTMEQGRTAVGRVPLSGATAASLPAAAVRAADLDGDGTDELVVVLAPDPELEPHFFNQSVAVLRWDGEGFDLVPTPAVQTIASGPLVGLGDSNGLPGEEVGYVVTSFDQVAPRLVRIGMDAQGAVTVESGRLPAAGQLAPVDGADGGRLVLVSEAGTTLLYWPADAADPEVVASTWRGGELFGVLGEGADASILVIRGGAVDVLDPGLGSRQGIAGSTATARFIASGDQPYRGPLPGGDPVGGDQAVIFSGRLITLHTGRGGDIPGFQLTRLVAGLAGMAPVGLQGVDNGWAAVARPALPPMDRRGGTLDPPAADAATAMWLVPASELLQTAADDGELEPRIVGGVRDATRELPTLLTAGSLTAEVQAPAGSEVRARAHRGQTTLVSVQTVGASGRKEIVLSDGGTEGVLFTVELEVVTPAGHGYGARWQVRIVQHAPRLDVDADSASLSFSVPLAGRTERGVRLEVDGSAVGVAPDGSFRTSVPAGFLPRDVPLRATDQLGNVTERTISVVGPFDYRTLPWVPITLVVTVLVAIFVYVRTPAASRPRAANGSLEELD